MSLRNAIKADWETMSFKRGGSTITMQLAKNLYLSPSKNPLRKAKEIVIAWQLEQALSKRRIFEIYLNVVEFGRNIYGAEAAARHYFGKSAAVLDPLEAATLAALLPSPRSSRGEKYSDAPQPDSHPPLQRRPDQQGRARPVKAGAAV